MPIKARCPYCKLYKVRVPDHAIGQSVTCKKCHDVSNWASEDKHEKTAARGMLAMTKDINAKYLQTMEGVDKDASVNCGTCHRGHAKPSEGMKPPGGAPGGH